jgi:hypothetical protein
MGIKTPLSSPPSFFTLTSLHSFKNSISPSTMLSLPVLALLATLATAWPASFYTGHDCGGLFLYDLDLPNDAGCTTMPLGEQPWSLHFVDPPAGTCSVNFFSDAACTNYQVILDGDNTAGKSCRNPGVVEQGRKEGADHVCVVDICVNSGSQIVAYSVGSC